MLLFFGMRRSISNLSAMLVRAVTTGWKYYEEGVRDIDELVAAVESVEDDVTDEEMLLT